MSDKFAPGSAWRLSPMVSHGGEAMLVVAVAPSAWMNARNDVVDLSLLQQGKERLNSLTSCLESGGWKHPPTRLA